MTRLGGLTFAYLINTRAISMPIVWYRQNSPLSPGHKSCAYIYWFPSPIEKVMLIYDFSYKLVLACVVLRKKTKAGSRFSSGNRSNFLWPVKKLIFYVLPNWESFLSTKQRKYGKRRNTFFFCLMVAVEDGEYFSVEIYSIFDGANGPVGIKTEPIIQRRGWQDGKSFIFYWRLAELFHFQRWT